MTIWRNIEGHNGYEVSDAGDVKNSITGRILKQSQHRQGYSMVWLSDKGNVYGRTVHRLVAEAFIPNPRYKPQVNHIDGNKTNNGIDNLEWNTGSENTIHAYKTGLFGGRPKVPIRIVETGQVFDSISECAASIGGSKGNISACVQGKLDSYRNLHFESVK